MVAAQFFSFFSIRRVIRNPPNAPPPATWKSARLALLPMEEGVPARGDYQLLIIATHLSSCEEAQFYLTQCGVGSLDGNRDGVPCLTLCR
jgi:hypothetical protein